MRPSQAELGSVLLLILPSLLFLSDPLCAQQEVQAEIRGEVRVGTEPMAVGTVVLHQVSEDASGEIDSVSVAADGSFVLPLPHVPDHASRPEIFFASVEYGGLLYFGPAVTEAFQLDSLYLIQAFDTVSAPPGGATLPLSARNIFLEKIEAGWMATDVFELRNDGTHTLYSPDEGIVWRYPLPASVTDFQVGQADMAPDVVRLEEGELTVYSPLPPGDRYLMVRYRIAEDDFVVPMPGETDRMEVLVQEPAPPAEFYPLQLSDPVELEPGNAFRRYAGDSLVNAEVRSEIAPEPWSLPAEWLGLLMAGLLGAAGVAAYRLRARKEADVPGPAVGGTERDRVLLRIAELDQAFDALELPSEKQRQEYRTARDSLLTKLKRLS